MTKLVSAQNDLIPVETIEEIKRIEQAAKEIKKAQEEMKEKLLALMVEKGILSWESLDKTLQMTFVPESETITLDSKALKAECPDVYDAYARVSKKKASVRITVRKDA